MKKYVVTGCAGFIGSHLVAALLDRGDAVVGLDSFSDFYSRSLKEANIEQFMDQAEFDLLAADLNEIDVAAVITDAAGVFHLAAQPGVRGSWGDSFSFYARDNIVATQRLLDASRRRGTRVVFASSSSVYGNAEAYPTSEDVRPDPISPYGVTKLTCEHLARAYETGFGLETVALRYFTVYGPRQRPDMAFSRMVDVLLNGGQFAIFGDGRQSRDFTYVGDAVDATLAAMESGSAGSVYNVGGGTEVSLLEAAAVAETVAGKPLQTTIGKTAKGDVARTSADTRSIKHDLGWAPKVSLADGLERQLQWASELKPKVIAATSRL